MKVDFGINQKYIKIAIWVVVAIVAIIVIRKIWKKIKEKIDIEKVSKKLGQDIVVSDLSYTDGEYTILAERLVGALNDRKSGYRGVNQEQVYEVFRAMKTNSDLIKLTDAFGTRTLDLAWTSGAKDGDYTLWQVMSSRVLTDGEKAEIRAILADNNVTYPF